MLVISKERSNVYEKNSEKKHFGFMRFVSFSCILFVVLLLTIGYSSLNVNLTMNDTQAFLRVYRVIRVFSLTLNNVTNNANVGNTSYSTNDIMATISLPNSDSTVTFNIDITNLGNVEMSVVDITGLPNNLTYILGNYTKEAALCDYVG